MISSNIFNFLEPLWAIAGWAFAKIGYIIRKKIRLKKIRHFFGHSASLEESMALIIPIFHPLSFSKFASSKSIVNKIIYTQDDDPLKQEVPLTNKVIVLEDYQATESLNRLMNNYDLKPLKMLYDDSWFTSRSLPNCLICIGGPRSNQKVADILSLNKEFLEVDESGDTLDKWRFVLYKPRLFNLKVHKDKGIGIIFRSPNSDNKRNFNVSIFGCRAETTIATAEFIEKHFDEIEKFVDGDFLLIILSIMGSSFDTIKPMYIATQNNEIEYNKKLIDLYCESNNCNSNI